MRRSLLVSLGLALLVVTVGTTGPVAGASDGTEGGEAATGRRGGVAWHRPAGTGREAADHWTDERLAAATPLPLETVPGAGPAAESAGVPRRESAPVGRPYTTRTARAIGKVFFTSADGRDFVCSGTAVRNSRNRRVVWTAGHCVFDATTGGWHDNWVFIPAYSSSYPGHRPYGTWTANVLWAPSGWIDQGSLRLDLGAAVVAPLNGRTLVDRVGGHSIAFNLNPDRRYRAVGYPGSPGHDQRRCRSGLRGRDRFAGGPGPVPLYIRCNLAPGSSGGPWLHRINTAGVGTIGSVNSYRYTTTPALMFGPYLGRDARSLFTAAANDTR